MDESEKFDIKKMVSAPLTGIFWAKVVMFSLGAVLLFLLGYAVYKAYIKKPQAEVKNEIKVESGSSLHIDQRIDRKKVLIPFVEGYVEQRTSENFQTGLRAGVRFEW